MRVTAISTSRQSLVAIDLYAEKALGNRDDLLNKPYSNGGSKKAGDVP